LSRESHRADAMIPASLGYLRSCRRDGPPLPDDQETRRQ
ncbi:MAG: sugar phosphate isomerase/epimerase, partial [Methylobacterium sp.]